MPPAHRSSCVLRELPSKRCPWREPRRNRLVLSYWLPWNEHGGRPEGQQLRPSGSYSPCSRTSERGAFVALASRQRSIHGIFTPQYSPRCGLAEAAVALAERTPRQDVCVLAAGTRTRGLSPATKRQNDKFPSQELRVFFSLNFG